jgi:type 1 glutamine amidotransferase
MRNVHRLTCAATAAAILCLAQNQPPAPAAGRGGRGGAQTPARTGKKHVLVIGQTKGFEHDSVPIAMANIWKWGHDTGLWEAYLRSDTELLTKKKLDRNGKNLDYFDVVVFASPTGELDLDESQKSDLLSFVREDGRGFVGVHASADSNYQWEGYNLLTGGWFDQHPWNTFDAPIVLEDPDFPAVRHLPKAFLKRDEIYQLKNWSRDNVNVLLRLDETKLNYENNPRVHRADRDFAVAYSKMFGKGRVFYSTLGHTNESWDDPDISKMYFEAIRWALGMTEGSTTPHAKR